jgi:hypothetical protein
MKRAPSGTPQAIHPGNKNPPQNATAASGEKFGQSAKTVACKTRNVAKRTRQTQVIKMAVLLAELGA